MQLHVLHVAVAVAGLASKALAQNLTALVIDPVKDYCVRLNHQSVVKNGYLYIDGGIQTFTRNNTGGVPINGTIVTGYNDYLIQVDMRTSWDWYSNITQVLLPKKANPSTGTLPPFVIQGALYQGGFNDGNVYLYGGTTSYINTSFSGYVPPSSNQYSLWSFDTTTEQWNQWDVTDTSPLRPSAGAYAEAPDQALAFYLNGRIDSGSALDTQFVLGNTKVVVEGMVVINTTTQTARNLSTTDLSGSNARTRGSLTYLPGIGEKGILVNLGGSYKNVDDYDDVDIGTLLPMDTIDVFDVASSYNGNGSWYQQNATGNIPAPRVDHCATVVSAPDNSSHNIYVYGGRSSDTALFDQIYVLSLPSFHWTKVFGDGNSPRYGMTCHTVGLRQMITVGGFSSAKINSTCDWEAKGVAILDMATMKWGSVFDAGAAPYTVPPAVVADIGGTINGGANFTRPAGDWANADIATLFGSALLPTNTTTPHPPSSTPSPAPTTMPAGAIVGIVVGCVAGLGLLFGLIWGLIRRRDRDRSPKPQPPPLYETDGEQYYEKDGSGRPPPPAKDQPSELDSPISAASHHRLEKGRLASELATDQPASELP